MKSKITSTTWRLLAGIAMSMTAISANAQAAQPANSAVVGTVKIQLPQRIPLQCVKNSAQRYQLPEIALLAILKVESSGRLGVVGVNSDGAKSRDYGPAQLNDHSWGKYMVEKYGISLKSLTNDMCQAIMAQGYALRSEMNRCIKAGFTGSDRVWCGVALYHHGGAIPSSTSNTAREERIHGLQRVYVTKVWKAQQRMVAAGKFD